MNDGDQQNIGITAQKITAMNVPQTEMIKRKFQPSDNMFPTCNVSVAFQKIPGRITKELFAMHKAELIEMDVDYGFFREMIFETAKEHFCRALNMMLPLFEMRGDVNKINLKFEVRPEALAGFYNQPNRRKGVYMLCASDELLYEYALEYFFGDTPDTRVASVWYHELMHLLDHENLELLASIPKPPNSVEALVYMMMRYRCEGIAEMYFLLNGFSKFRSVQTARSVFKRKMNRLITKWPEGRSMVGRVCAFCIKDHGLYDIGVWMILHILGCQDSKAYTPEAAIVANKIRKRKQLSENEILVMMEKALAIDNKTFIDCITKPGADGAPFITCDELHWIAGRVGGESTVAMKRCSQSPKYQINPKVNEMYEYMRAIC